MLLAVLGLFADSHRIAAFIQSGVAHKALMIDSMKIGLRTAWWIHRLQQTGETISEAKALGFDGVEFTQKSHALPSGSELRASMDAAGLSLLGLSGGSLADQLRFASGAIPQFLFVEDIRGIPECGMQVLFRPRFRASRGLPEILEEISGDCPEVRLCLDVVYLFLSGLSFGAIRDVVERCFPLLSMVILHDWCRGHAYSTFRLGHGFAVPGTGELGDFLGQLVRDLEATGYQEWILVDQRLASDPTIDALTKTMDWLESGILK